MRNRSIDVYKFLFCVIIMFFHFYRQTDEHMIGGAGGVEFFVLAASMFFYQKFYKTRVSGGMSNLRYAKKRFMRFFPYTTAAFIIALFTNRIIPRILEEKATTFLQLYKWFSKDIWELLLLFSCGVNGNSGMLNGTVWTLSAMLICEFFVWGLLQHNEKLFRTLLAPLAFLTILGFWKNMDTADKDLWIGFTTFGVLRVFLLMCLGYYVYALSMRLQKMSLSRYARVWLTVCEFLCIGISLVNMNFFSTRYFRYENILLFSVAIIIAYSGQSFSGKIFAVESVTKYLGELSLGVYLIHDPILKVFRQIYPDPYVMYAHKFVYLLAVLVISAVFLVAVKRLTALFSKLKEKAMRKAVIQA